MDTARILLTLKQGSRSLENYIHEFLAIANYSDLPDCLLIEFFCDGINQPLQSEFRREGPRSSLAQFMDYALLTIGSLLTVGVAEEEHGTAFMTEIAATLEHAHKMAATADPVHKMADTTTHRHFSADLWESSHVTVDRHELSQVTVDLPESLHIFADLPESLHVSADHPESHHVTADNPESCNNLPLTPRYSRSVLRFPSLVSSVRDVPLVSARAAGIPKSTHSNPYVPELISLPEALPMMGIALCCVWAAYSTTELLEVAKSTVMSPEVAAHAAEPPEAAVLASAPCMVVAPSNSYPACHITVEGTVDEHCPYPVNELYLFPDVTTVEPPEMAASAAEPSEVSVVDTYESLSCPVTAMEAVCECSSCPVTAMEAVCESLSCPVVAMEAICELLPCFELATEAINEPSFAHVTAYELLSCPESAEEAGYELPVPSVTTEEVMGELPYCCIAPLGPVRELLILPVMNSEIINAPHICPVNPITAMEAVDKPSVSSVSVNKFPFELSVCLAPTESDCEIFACLISLTEMFASPVSASAPGFDLSAGPLFPGVSNSESFVLPVSVCVSNPELTVCPVNPVTTTETIYELPAFLVSVKLDSEPTVSSDSVSKSDVKPIVSPISANGSEYEQSVYLAFIPELSVSPESVNASICELSVGLYSAVKSDAEVSAYPVSTSEPVGELFTCPVSISELTYELSVPSVVTRVNIDGLVFPAPVL